MVGTLSGASWEERGNNMENKITLEGLIAEMRQEVYDAGYNEGYGDALGSRGILLKSAKEMLAALKGETLKRDWAIWEEDIRKAEEES